MTGQHEGEQALDVTGRYNKRAVKRYLTILKDIYGDYLEQLSNGSWLDIGCGHGEFLSAMSVHSSGKLKLKGTEPNQHKANTARSRGLDVDSINLESHDETYDFISVLNVYGHLPDPIKSLTNWKNLLKKDGELLLETGHTALLDQKENPGPYLLPDHLSCANRDIVVSILERLGFEIMGMRMYRYSLRPKLKPKALASELRKLVLRQSTPYASFRRYFPREPLRDMFIRARLKS
jgi:SAM-dependent methyltransferase